MSKQELKDDIIRMVSLMEQNTFLLPDGWSDNIQMASCNAMYRTYVQKRGVNRYMALEYDDEKSKVRLTISRDSVGTTETNLLSKRTTVKEAHRIVSAIYNEMHSFKDGAEGKASIRKEIREKRKKISDLKAEIVALEQRLVDAELLREDEVK